MSDLLVIEFPTEAQAEEVRQKLLAMQGEYLIELGDAVVATKSAEGQVKLNQLFQPVKAGAVSGMFWGTLIGLLFMMPLAGAAVGAASGALGGKMTDLGINDDFMKDAAKTCNRATRVVPADPQDDHRQSAGRPARCRRYGPAQLVRRDEGRGASGGARRRPGGNRRSSRRHRRLSLPTRPSPGKRLQARMGNRRNLWRAFPSVPAVTPTATGHLAPAVGSTGANNSRRAPGINVASGLTRTSGSPIGPRTVKVAASAPSERLPDIIGPSNGIRPNIRLSA